MKKELFALSLIITGLILVGFSSYKQIALRDGITVYSFTTATSDGTRIKGDVYVPNEIKYDKLVVFVHGFSGNRRYWKTAILAFTEVGFTCLALDLRGHGGSLGFMISNVSSDYPLFEQDVSSAIKWVKSNIRDFDSIILVGHSMGGGLVIYLGFKWHRNVSTVIAMAPALFGDFLNSTQPSNLLLIVGSRDSLIKPNYVKSLFKEASGVLPNDTFYEYETSEGAIRGFYLDDDADHASIVMDKDAIEVSINWVLEKLYSRKVSDISYTGQEEALINTLSLLSSIALLLATIMLVSSRVKVNQGSSTEPRSTEKLNISDVMDYIMRSIIYPGFIGVFLFAGLAIALVFIPPFPVAHIVLAALLANLVLTPLVFRRSVKESLKEAFNDFKNIKLNELLIGLVIFASLLIPLHISTYAFYPPSLISSEIRLLSAAIYAIILIPFLMSDERLFRGIIRASLGAQDKWSTAVKSAGIYALVKLSSLLILTVIGMGVYSFIISSIIGGVLLPATTYAWLLLVIPEVIYHFSRNYKVSAIFNSLLIALILAQFSAAILLI